MTNPVLYSHVLTGDYESAYRLAHATGSAPELIEALSVLCDTPTEEQIESQLSQCSEEEYERGRDDGKDEGYSEARYDADTLAERHRRALAPAIMALDSLRDRMSPGDLHTFDCILAALDMIAEELGDFDDALAEASRDNR